MAASWAAVSWVTAVVFLVLLLNMSLTSGQQQLEECHKGLFVSDDSLVALKKSSAGAVSFAILYNLTSYRREVTYPESCGIGVDKRSGSAYLTHCKTSSLYKSLLTKRASGTCQPCQSQMSFSVPLTVTDVYSGAEFTATHYSDSYQLLHTGHCVSEGAECGYQGRCQQVMRIEWVLVDLPTGNKFMPTSIPSHCTCIYT